MAANSGPAVEGAPRSPASAPCERTGLAAFIRTVNTISEASFCFHLPSGGVICEALGQGSDRKA
jgi:hypothetical protein